MSSLKIEDLKSTTPLFEYSENDLVSILKEHGKTVQNILEDVKIIKEWLKLQHHLPEHPSDRQIASFLVNNKCSIEKTKQKIDMSYTIRTLIPDFYEGIYPKSKKVVECFKYSNTVCIPKLTKDLNRLIIFYYHPGNEVLKSETIFGVTFMYLQLMTLVDFINGYEIIVDLSKVSFTFGATFTPMVLKKFSQVLEHVFSGRLKAIRFINVPKVLNYVVDMVAVLFKAKFKSRVEFIQGYDRLIEVYGKDFLPSNFGGTGDSIENLQVEYLQFLNSRNDYFEKLQSLKVNEKLRPEKLQNDEFLGYYGNFKKLSID